MQAAKEAIKNFTNKDGRHDTTVHEKVNPAVQNETVTRNQQDRVTTAVDKEVHQDHYHTSVQPIQHKETLAEKHHHNLVGVEHRNFEHDDASKVKQRLAQEQAQFKDSHERVEGTHTTHAQPTVAGEHIHHHVHENIQPVINKQTVEPHVVHTTVPIHEVHHNAAQHHSASALPTMSMDEFKKNGGTLSGRDTRTEGFDGCPKTVGDPHDPLGMTGHGHHHNHGSTTSVPTTSGLRDGHTTSGGLTGHKDVDPNTRTGAGVGADGLAAGTATAGATGAHGTHGASGHGLDNSATHSSTGATKPSLMDRLNPTKDADGDGKKGFMK